MTEFGLRRGAYHDAGSPREYDAQAVLPLPLDLGKPSSSAVDRARSLLDRALGMSKVLTERASCEAYATDDSDVPGIVPDAVVLASSADDIA